jgi:anti-sigma factor RsiW
MEKWTLGMDCNELVEVITDYIEGDLPAEDVTIFEKHLAECPGCQTYLEQMRRVIRAAGKLEEQHIPSQGKEELLKVFRDWKKDTTTPES